MVDTFKELDISAAYNSDENNILQEFYIPTLSVASKYDRFAGFFSSASFALAARGLKEFIEKGGKMRLIVNKILSKDDKEIMEKVFSGNSNSSNFLSEEVESWNLENELIKNHVSVFGWMLKEGKLKMKIAFTREGGLVHQKIGILEDVRGNKLSFSGSNNETPQGWSGNIEEFKVFRSWEDEGKKYVNVDETNFNIFWRGKAKRAIVVDAPDAVKNKLIKIAPKNFNALNLDSVKLEKLLLLNSESISQAMKVELRDFQREAVDSWVNNGHRGILSMATGTGKTFTALGCLNKIYELDEKSLCVISAPYNHLVAQWGKEIKKITTDGVVEDFGKISTIKSREIVILGSSGKNWKNSLLNKLTEVRTGLLDKLLIITTHDSLASNILTQNIKELDNKKVIIADEVHGLGAGKRREGLMDEYNYRLGLSATPERWMDEEGTGVLESYFTKVTFEFSLEKAINTINPSTGKTYLTPYYYYPYFTELTDEESDEYFALTQEIGKKYNYKDNNNEFSEFLKLLLIKRANILKKSQNKLEILPEILTDIEKQSEELRDILIYCSDMDQLSEVQAILNRMHIRNHKFTGSEGTRREEKYGGFSERSEILRKFVSGYYQVLVAIKCLDEGIDIPSAKYGVFLASSTNPREFIQRRGRLLRYFEGKNFSYIYDVLIVPPMNLGKDELVRKMERAIYKKEIARFKEFAKISYNSSECILKLIKVERERYLFK